MANIGNSAKPFLRKNENGKTRYLTLKQFRREIEAGTAELPMWDEGGCGCFTDEVAA